MLETGTDRQGHASFAQQGIWATERTGAAGSAYHMPLALRLDGALDVQALLDACGAVVARHPVLASAVEELDGELRLVPAASSPPVVFEDLSAAPAGTLEHHVREDTLRGFDLRHGPLVRFRLLADAPERHLLLVVAHHFVFDGESKDVLLRDLAACYRARVESGASRPDLPELPAGYGEHAAAEREHVAAVLPAATAFWEPRWEAPPAVRLPGIRSPGRAGTGRAVEGTALELTLDQRLWQDTTSAAQGLGVTTFELLLAAVHTLLHRYGNTQPVVAVDLGTRTPETREHVGLFVNELPVRSSPAPAMRFRELAAAVRADLREIYRFRSVPLARAVGGITPRAALTPVSLSYRKRGADPDFPGLDVAADWAMFNHAARNTLHIQVVEGPGQVTVSLRHSPDTVGRDDVARIAEHLRTLLAGVAADPDTRLADVPLPGADERAQGDPERADPTATPVAPQVDEPAGEDNGTAPAPASGLAGEIGEIWREVLQIDEIRPDEDLFDLGGHSLTITQIAARIHQRFGVEVPLEVFFETPTVAGVAGAVAELRQEAR